MNRLFKIMLNSASLLLTLVVSYLSNTDLIGQTSVGGVSERYSTVITPAAYAFSIWGLIYLLLLGFVGYQWYSWIKNEHSDVVDRTGYYFILSNLANASWVIAWVNGYIGISVGFILVLLGSLIKLVQRLNLEKWDAPFPIILFVWWPIVIYFGWVILAAVLNIQVFIVSLGWDQETLSAEIFGAVLLALSTVVYLYLIYSRNLRESAVVGAWGLAAIAVRQSDVNPVVTGVAVVSATVLLINVMIHAFRNREHSFFKTAFRSF